MLIDYFSINTVASVGVLCFCHHFVKFFLFKFISTKYHHRVDFKIILNSILQNQKWCDIYIIVPCCVLRYCFSPVTQVYICNLQTPSRKQFNPAAKKLTTKPQTRNFFSLKLRDSPRVWQLLAWCFKWALDRCRFLRNIWLINLLLEAKYIMSRNDQAVIVALSPDLFLKDLFDPINVLARATSSLIGKFTKITLKNYYFHN